MSNTRAIDPKLTRHPIFFERNRVFRVYRGGKLFHDFFWDNAGDPPEDGHLPEEWVASDVKAMNAKSRYPKEGVSRVRGTEVWLDELIAAYPGEMMGAGASLEVLVKLLDSAIRLPVQAHPDKAFSMKHFQSSHGKAEAWLVLATRPNACLYIGFKEKMDKDAFMRACRRSETERDHLEGLLNRVEAKAGQLYFMPAGMVHAIGPGCLILEVQEPTDFTMQPEAWCEDYHLSPFEQTLGLPMETAMDCFDFSLYGERALQAARKKPQLLEKREGAFQCEQLIGPADTDCFSVRRYRLENGALEGLKGPAVYIVTEGSGLLRDGELAHSLNRGDYFMLPACISGACSVTGTLELVRCDPPGA